MIICYLLQIILYFCLRNATLTNPIDIYFLQEEALMKFIENNAKEKAARIQNYINTSYCYGLNIDCTTLKIRFEPLRKVSTFPKIFCELNLIKELIISNCGITTLPQEFSKFKNLRILDLSQNRFYCIPDVIFNLPNLFKLNMSNNCIIFIPDGIANLKELNILDLNNNYIKSIPDIFNDLKQLKVVFLTCNGRSLDREDSARNIIDQTLKNISTATESLKAGGCNLYHLPLDFNVCNALVLSLEENNLSSLPQTFEQFSVLRILNLARNNFTMIPNELLNLKDLEMLSFSGNKIIAVVFLPTNFMNLNSLYLSKNNIAYVSIYDGALRNLTELHIYENNIEKITIFKGNNHTLDGNYLLFPDILELCITFQGLDKIDYLRYFKNVTSCDLSFLTLCSSSMIDIKERFDFFLDFTQIKELHITNSKLFFIPEVFTKIPTLKLLDLSDNTLSCISENVSCFNLDILNLKNNKIQKISKNFFTLSNIKNLYLSNNSLENIPPLNENLRSKQYICIDNNPLDIFGRGGYLGILEIPPTWVDSISVAEIGNTAFLNAMCTSRLMWEANKLGLGWNIQKIRNMKPISVEKHKLQYEELRNIFIEITSQLDDEILKNRSLRYLDVIYKKVEEEGIQNTMGESYRDTIKDYLEAFIIMLSKENRETIKNALEILSPSFDVCYDGQMENFFQIFRKYRNIDYDDFSKVVEIFLDGLKNDALIYVTTSNTYIENVQILQCWKMKLSQVLGFFHEKHLFQSTIPYSLLRSSNYVIYQFFKKFSVDNAIRELQILTNSKELYITKVAEFLYSRNAVNNTTYKMYFDCEGVADDMLISGIEEDGIVAYLYLNNYLSYISN
ncbi:Leucine rich repeat protein [Spraguea lophii 42_110]|uniref:Leucine rich repeat protein n=1 Tax=Spraguea lophii (strain 42_110) TaxID=1358809 RepID=S7W5I6_SPRLO|nr:Leucine rich repeat protein [Spraguea lophii 42_110]